MSGLAGLRVVDCSTQLAGPYCSKLFADAGAEVVKVEPPGGDPMRRWSATGADLAGSDGPLFAFLNAGKRTVTGAVGDPHVRELLADADLVIGAHGLAGDAGERLDPDTLRSAHPALVVLTISPYGCEGPWAERLATDLTLQAESGSIGIRGLPGGEPFQAGGRITEWAAGAYGAVAALAAVQHARASGRGEHVDLSLLETASLVFPNFSVTINRLLNGGTGVPEHAFLAPVVETPSIERTADGYVGFCTNAPQQFADFLVLIDRADLLEDDELAQVGGRILRFDEWSGIVDAWCSARTTDEVIEQASLFRIPVSPVCNGQTVLDQDHLVERGVFRDATDGAFRHPRRPYLIDGADGTGTGEGVDEGVEDGPGDHTDRQAGDGDGDGAGPEAGPAGPGWHRPADASLPLGGLRVLDLTAWWAGPAATHLLASLGAEVVHLESTRRPDGMRMVGGMAAANYPQWWEASPHFLHANTNKLGVTLDLGHPRGLESAERLVAWCDVVVENYTPRVLDQFGLTWERVQEINPRAVLVRMPAFGLTGPWRDRPGFAQNVEQLSGLAWVTGHRDDQPRIPRGPCDPIAGAHAAFATLVALATRSRSGRGHHVEVPLAEVALNVAAEQVVEFTAHGRLLQRDGNRSPAAAPQGLYACAGATTATDGWVAVSVTDDEQWRQLRAAVGEPEWAADPELDSLDGRRHHHDRLDDHLREWTSTRTGPEVEAELRALGVPAVLVADPSRLVEQNPQLAHRGYFERPDHPVVGPMPLPGLPFRFSGVDRWLRAPAPTLGRDNDTVLGDLLGLDTAARAALAEAGVVGTWPKGLGGS